MNTRVWMLLSLAWWSSATALETVQVCVMAPLSGPQSPSGRSVWRGVQVALEERRSELNRVGLSVRLCNFDDQGDPATGAANARRLLAQRTIAVIGPLSSGAALVVAPILRSANVAMLTPTATAVSLTGQGWRHVFRWAPRDDVIGVAGALYLANEVKARRVLIVDADGGSATAEAAERTLRSRAVVVRRASVGTILSESFDAVYVAGDLNVAAQVKRTLQERGSKATILLDWLNDADLFNTSFGSSLVGTLFMSWEVPPSENARLRALMSKLGNVPSKGKALVGYEAANAMIFALRDARRLNPQGTLTPEEVRSALAKVRLTTLLNENVSFDARGDRASISMYVRRLEANGQAPVVFSLPAPTTPSP
ncbi:branched-chain amino acid ABC transporter substrate-binding protein [Deinococcus yavapaiensis]|uniref:Branched-chain amino acid transport system substrate-binding protein n=1 Tax=Deinococcus yavapaiensis KR-236 TaxID=694435 RepID=A0A318S2C0_9DEIO|nr:branched-chain amino acid ABC transporter substrate-binding protein [Deinococcus yavapaiensis]PYE52066.1 branched-chain amino acid transport system substrate-binding protein [Deinococcus yavapaiensis KR-236]